MFKIEEIYMDIEENGIFFVNFVNVQNMFFFRVFFGGYGNVFMDNFVGDMKLNLIFMNQEGDLFELGVGIIGLKIRGMNSFCMFGSGNFISERNC